MLWKRVQPRHSVCHPGGCFFGFFMYPPARAGSTQNSPTVYDTTRPDCIRPSTSTHARGTTDSAGKSANAGVRADSRRFSVATEVTLSTATNAAIFPTLCTWQPSTDAPLFCTLYNSSTCIRHEYHRATRSTSAGVPAGSLVRTIHSNAPAPSAASASQTRTAGTGSRRDSPLRTCGPVAAGRDRPDLVDPPQPQPALAVEPVAAVGG